MKNILIVLLIGTLLVGCSGTGKAESAKVVESYWQAVVGKQLDTAISLACADYENDVRLVFDSFQAVTAKLDGLDCTQASIDGNNAVVTCKGSIIATYGNEDRTLSLADQSYMVSNAGGDWRVCGTK